MKKVNNHSSIALSSALAAVIAAAAVATPSVAFARDAVTYLDYVTVPNGAYAFLETVKPEGDWKIKVDFASAMTGTFGLFCCNDSANSYAKRLNLYNISGSGNGWRLDVNNDNGTAANGGLSGVNVKLNVRQTMVYDAGKVFLDGTQIIDRSSDVTGVTSANAAPIALFANNSGPGRWVNQGQGRIYGAQIWDGEGTLVRDLRPCKTAAGVAALYDAVSGAVYPSASGTAFTAGPEASPDGVEFLEYVTTSEYSNPSGYGQFFNTEYLPEYNCRIELDVTPLSDPTAKNIAFFYSCRNASPLNRLGLFHIYNASPSAALRLDTGDSNKLATEPAKRNVRRTYAYNNGVVSVDGETLIDDSERVAGLSSPPDMPIIIGASYGGGNDPARPNSNIFNFSSLRIYRFRVWDGSGVIQRDMRPAKDAAGNVALYDLVNRKFHYCQYRSNTALAAVGGVDENFPVGPEMDYMKTQGNVTGGKQWYDTGYIPTGLEKIEMDVKTPAASGTYMLFSSQHSNLNQLRLLNIGGSGLRIDVNNQNEQSSTKLSSARHTMLYDGGKLYVDGASSPIADKSSAASAMDTAGSRLYLCANGTDYSANLYNFTALDIYGVKIWDHDSGTLIRDFVPARTASGFVGLYDKAGDKFYKSGNDYVSTGRNVSAIAGTTNAPTAAQIEAAGDVLASADIANGGSKIAVPGGFAEKTEENIVCPFAGKTTTAHCANFPQSFTVTAAGEGTNVVTATTGFASLGKPFTSADGTSWTVVLRVKREAKGVDVADTVLSLGSDCAKDGLKIGFCGSEANRRLDVRVGGEVWPGLSGFLAPAGDWLDIAVSVDASTGAVRVYYCREGESVIWADKTFAVSATSETLVNLAARPTWSVKVGGEVAVSDAEVGRIVDGKWTMFDDALKAFKGSVESVAIWSRKLSDAEVLAAFNAVPHFDAFTIIFR